MLSEVEQICTKIIIIAAGQLIAQGSPDDLRRQVSAESRLIAEIRGPADKIRNAVHAMDGVATVNLVRSDDWCRLSIAGNGTADLREPLARLARDHGWGIRELRREVASLEDYFVNIVAQQAEAEGR